MKFPAKEFEISNYLAHRKSSLNPNYSYLSNKRGAHAYWFWKIPPSTFIEFLDFSTLHSSFIRVMY